VFDAAVSWNYYLLHQLGFLYFLDLMLCWKMWAHTLKAYDTVCLYLLSYRSASTVQCHLQHKYY